VGVLAAFVYRADVWALPFLVPPVVAIFYAYQRWVAMQYETEEAMIALAEVVEDRDPSTARHSQRVAEYAVALGQRIGLDDRHLRSLELAGRLHDLGKIGIDNSVLLKPGLLTAEEYRRMQAHPELSSKILQWFTFAKEEAKYIHLHHERMDGRGYPYGLSGEQIPLPARILSIADAFDAMTTDRPYRAGMSVAEALATLRANAGTQFDAELVEQFVALQQERAAEAVERSPATAIAVLGVEEQ
jgi:HD-GYP domain-containing protein (c-di-GMP phosphodiesterase class II)